MSTKMPGAGAPHRQYSTKSSPRSSGGRKSAQAGARATKTHASHPDEVNSRSKRRDHSDDGSDDYDDDAEPTPRDEPFLARPSKRDVQQLTRGNITLDPEDEILDSEAEEELDDPPYPDASSSDGEPNDHLDTSGIEISNFFSQQTTLPSGSSGQEEIIPTDPDLLQAHRKTMNDKYLGLLQQPLPGEEHVEDCTIKSAMYVRTLMQEVEHYDAQFVRHELADQKTLGNIPFESAVERVFLIRMTTSPRIHECIVECNLPQMYHVDQQLQQELSAMQARCRLVTKQPRIYANFLCNKMTGEMMTPLEIEKVVSSVQDYICDDAFAAEIDNMIGDGLDEEYTSRGARRYLTTELDKEPGKLPSVVRVRRLGVLCRALLRRIEKIPREKWYEPAPGSLSEFGFSDDVSRRLAEHQEHRLSNYLLNLAELLAEYHFPGKYCIEQFVVYHIPLLDLSEMAEMYFTRAGQGYAINGGGLSHTGAGRSTWSRNKYNQEAYKGFWDYAKSSVFESNTAIWFRLLDGKAKGLWESYHQAQACAARKDTELCRLDRLEGQVRDDDELNTEEKDAARQLYEVHRMLDEVEQTFDTST